MNAELTRKLLKRFPILYQDYDSPMTQTCMCWGLDHGDGWFEIIWQLSLAIEEELEYSWPRERWYLLKKALFRSWNRFIYVLSPIRPDKRKQEGAGTKEDPIRWVVTEEAPRDLLARLASKLFPPLRFDDYRSRTGKLQRLGFKAFIHHPYPGNDVIYRYVRLAERLSAVTCEDCGKPGKANDSGWIYTLCDDCRTRGPASPYG